MIAEWPKLTDDPAQAEADLARAGICFVSEILSPPLLAEVRAALYRAARLDESRGTRQRGFALDHGDGNHRVWNVLSRDPVFVDLVQHPLALRLVKATLGWPCLLGNFSANITLPGSAGGVLHADQVFVPEPWAAAPQGCNVTWLLDDFTEDNGATRFVPGSHRFNRSPRPEDGDASIAVAAPAGTMVIFESRLWHRTGENHTTDRTRAALFGWYSRPIYRPQENWFLSLSPWVLEHATDELLTLLAWKSEGLGLVNGHSPR